MPVMSELPSRPPIATAPLSVILTAQNAAGYLVEVLKEWVAVLAGLARDYEILLVDDGSTDETAQLAQALPTPLPRLQLLRLERPSGLGAALRLGLRKVQYPLVCCCTCDRQYQPVELKRLLEHINQVDIVTGYRQWLPVPPALQFLGKVWRGFLRIAAGIDLEPLACWTGWAGARRWLLARALFGVRVQDVACAFRLLRRDILRHIPLQSDGSLAHVELLAKANFIGCWMMEVPVSYQPITPTSPGYAPALEPFAWRDLNRLLNHPDFSQPPPETTSLPQGPAPASSATGVPPFHLIL